MVILLQDPAHFPNFERFDRSSSARTGDSLDFAKFKVSFLWQDPK